MSALKFDDLKLEVIRADELEPYDIVLIHFDEKKVNAKAVSDWADRIFRHCRNRGLVSHGIKIQILKAPGGPGESEPTEPAPAESVKFREFL